MKSTSIKFITSTNFQLGAIVTVALYIAWALYWPTETFTATDKIPTISQATTPMTNVATKVDMGLHITSFPKFDFDTNSFLMNGIVWFRFPVGTESLNTIEQFLFHNSVDTQFSYKSKPTIKCINNEVLICFHIEKEFKAELDHRLFPIGDHRLFFIIKNTSITPYEILFNCPPENFTLSNDLLVSSWRPFRLTTKSGYINAPLVKNNNQAVISYPCVMFGIDFQNIGIGDLMSLYLPMFVLFFIILFALAIDVLDITRLNLIAASVPILVLFRLVITNGAPQVGYATHIDYVYYLLVVLSLLILLFQTYITLSTRHIKNLSEAEQKTMVSHLELINSIVIISSLASLVIPITYGTYLLKMVYVCA